MVCLFDLKILNLLKFVPLSVELALSSFRTESVSFNGKSNSKTLLACVRISSNLLWSQWIEYGLCLLVFLLWLFYSTKSNRRLILDLIRSTRKPYCQRCQHPFFTISAGRDPYWTAQSLPPNQSLSLSLNPTVREHNIVISCAKILRGKFSASVNNYLLLQVSS